MDLTPHILNNNYFGHIEPPVARCCSASFIAYCLLSQCLYDTPVPEVYFNLEHVRYRKEEGMHFFFIQIFPRTSEMNFDNRILTVKMIFTLLWHDARKANMTEKTLFFDRTKDEVRWERMKNSTYLPDLIKIIDQYNFNSKKERNNTKLIVHPNGSIRYAEYFTAKINCNQKSIWFPYEEYMCEQDIWPIDSYLNNFYDMRQSLKLSNDKKFKTIANNHKMHLFEGRCRYFVFPNETTKYISNCFWRFTISRNAHKIASQLLPSIAFTLLELFAYTFGKNLVIRFILLPGYFPYLRVIDENKTNWDWHPIAIFLYSRFLGSFFLLSWNFLIYTSIFPRQIKKLNYQRIQDSTWKRFLASVLVSCAIAGVILVKLLFFTEEMAIDPLYLKYKNIPAPYIDVRKEI